MPPRRRAPGNPGSTEYLSTLSRGATPRRAIYTRLSDANDDDSISVSDQLAKCRAYCASKGYAVTAEYTDIATGKTPKRQHYQQMMVDARADRFDGIVFYVGDRLYRGLRGAGPIIDLHDDRPRITFEAVAENFDIDYVGIWATMSGKELADIRRRTMGQRISRARDHGQLMSSWAPYWITRDPDSKKPVLDPERSRWVLHAIDRYMAGDSAEDIRSELRESAPPHLRAVSRRNGSKRQDCGWTQSTLTQLLKHPALCGELPYSWRETEPVEQPDGYVVQRVSKNDHKRIVVPVAPLLHRNALEHAECKGCELDGRPTFEDLRQKAQARRARLSSGHPATHAYPLRRMVHCIGCGGWLTAQTQATWQTRDKRTGKVYRGQMIAPKINLRCEGMAAPSREARICRRTVLANGTAIWTEVRDQLSKVARDPAAVDGIVRSIRAAIEASGPLGFDAARVDQITTALADLDRYEAANIARLDRSEVSEAAYRIRQGQIAEERRTLQAEKVELLQYRTLMQQAHQAEQDLRDGLTVLGTLLADGALTDDQWTPIVRAIVQRVDLTYDNQPVIRWPGEPALATT